MYFFYRSLSSWDQTFCILCVTLRKREEGLTNHEPVFFRDVYSQVLLTFTKVLTFIWNKAREDSTTEYTFDMTVSYRSNSHNKHGCQS